MIRPMPSSNWTNSRINWPHLLGCPLRLPKVGVLHCLPLLLMLLAAGCAQTSLTPRPIGIDHYRLADISTRRITILNQLPSLPVSVGRQWVFLAIPLGKILIENPSELVGSAIFRKLAERGYRPTVNAGPSPHPQTRRDHTVTTLSSAEISCSVPDLLFFRIVRCSVRLDGYRNADSNILISGVGINSEFRAVGFKPQLERSLEKAMSQAIDDLLNRMHL